MKARFPGQFWPESDDATKEDKKKCRDFFYGAWGQMRVSHRVYESRERGLLALTPKWAREGDVLMLIRRAYIPYVFTQVGNYHSRHAAEIQRLLSTTPASVNAHMSKVAQVYGVDPGQLTDPGHMNDMFNIGIIRERLKMRWEEAHPSENYVFHWGLTLKERLHQLQQRRAAAEGLVLHGEAYVKGVMYSEQIEQAICHTERIAIV